MREIRRPFCLKRNRRRTSPTRESGKAFLDREIFTMSYPLNFHPGKTVNQPILTRESGDSPGLASTDESLLRKKGVAIFFSRRESESLERVRRPLHGRCRSIVLPVISSCRWSVRSSQSL